MQIQPPNQGMPDPDPGKRIVAEIIQAAVMAIIGVLLRHLVQHMNPDAQQDQQVFDD